MFDLSEMDDTTVKVSAIIMTRECQKRGIKLYGH
jgi:hypothetical protein